MDRAFTHLMQELAELRLRRPEGSTCDEHKDAVAQRVDMNCTAAGFAPPPCAVHIRFEQASAGWRLIILTPPGRPIDVVRWLKPYNPSRIEIEPGLGPKSLTVHFEHLPLPWQGFLATVAVHCIEMTPEGTASFFTDCAGHRLQSVVQNGTGKPVVRVRESLTGPASTTLTRRQMEILALAVALGYYEVPRRLNLRDLAERVELSPAATSELLRRGERLIILSYFDAHAATVCAVAGMSHETAELQ